MEPNRMGAQRIKSKFNLEPAIWKYLLLLLNVGFVISSVLMISIGVSTYIMFEEMYSDMGDAFRMLSIFWMIVGVTTITIGVFGIFAAFKENATLVNLYGIAMTVVFLGSISAGIADFTLIPRSRHMVSDQLHSMILGYSYRHYWDNDYRLKMDWVQFKFECCGNSAPSDWHDLRGYWVPDHLSTNFSTGTNLMPASCCVQYSNYVNLTCEQHHNTGCFEPIYEILSTSIMTIGTFGLVLPMLQMMSIILAFVYGHIMSNRTSQRYGRLENDAVSM